MTGVQTCALPIYEQRKVMQVLAKDLEGFSQEQLVQRQGYLAEERELVEAAYKENRELLEEELISGALTREEYNEAMRLLAQEEVNDLLVIGAEYKKVWDARGDIPLEVQEKILADMGLTTKQIEDYFKRQEMAAIMSTAITIENSEKATEKVKEANAVWNNMVLDEKTGEVKTNLYEFIQESTQSEEGWENLEFIIHNAELNSNAQEIIQNAMEANGTWWDLEFPPHWARVETNVVQQSKTFLESEGVWNELDFMVQSAILTSTSKEEVKQILIDHGIWENLDYRKKHAYLGTNTKETVTQATRDHATWDAMPWKDKQPKIKVESNATGVARAAQWEIDQVRGKTVSISVALNRSSMSNAIDGIQAMRYAKGTNFHPGGLAVLGDGGKNEPYLTPQGHLGVSPNTDTLFSLPRGTKVWSSMEKFRQEARQRDILKPLLNKIPHFAEGTSRSFLDTPRRENQDMNSDIYNIYITANGDLPDSVIKKMAVKIEREIKSKNDRRKTSIGKGATF
mgnify:FL=1